LEIGWEGYVEAVKGYQHVEFAEVDELHIVVFAIVTPATFVKEEVYQFIGGEEDFCIKVFVTRDAAFILKIFLLILSTNRQSWLVRMLDSLKMYLLASVYALSWKMRVPWQSWGTEAVIFAEALTLSRFCIKPPFCPAKILIRRD
jgi:hypothetical protein